MGVPAVLAIVVALHTPELVATGEISPELAGDPNRWLQQRQTFIARMAREHAELHPKLPVVYHLDRDFVTAARTRQSIDVVDDCNSHELCGVATNELPFAWDNADVRAMFSLDKTRAAALLGQDHELAVLGVCCPTPTMRELPQARNIRGATVAVVNRPDSHLIANGSRAEIDRLRRLGYNTIALIPYAGQHGFAATEIRRYDAHPFGETDLSMFLGAARAHAAGMQVMLKPQVWTEGEHGGDPTKIEPRDWKQWFDSYQSFLVHHALLARAIGAEWLCIGTELSRTESRPEWRRLIATIRTIYRGRIIYAANFDAFEQTPFWDAVDAIGIDAYFPLSEDRNASDRALRDGAREAVARVDAVASKWRKLVVLTELGYPSTTAPWVAPWREDRAAQSSESDQARAFAAMLDAVAHSHAVSGFIIWKYESDPHRTDERGYLPKSKPAERVIARYLALPSL